MNHTTKSQKITSFHKDLATSIEAESHPTVLQAISRCFPHALAVHRAHPQNDILGVDFWIEQRLGQMKACDVKIRTVDYGYRYGKPQDAVLETNYGDGYGWALKSNRTDVYLFVCTDTGRAAAFDAIKLRMALECNLHAWQTQYKMLTTYTASGKGQPIPSRAIAVPVDVLQAAIDRLGAQ